MQAALVDPAEVLVLPLTYPGTGPRVAFEVATEFFVGEPWLRVHAAIVIAYDFALSRPLS